MGRRLTDYESADVNVSYVYDASGQRVSKTVNGVTTSFYYDDRGILVLSSSSDGTELRFYADANGNIDSFSYNNEQYYYVRNAQNDVIGITDSTGAFVARYTYDEWGNITTITDGQGVDVSTNPSHIANINPLRYRSYFYDAETGFYWLNTRYYDPEIGRFINADGYLSTGQGVIGHNMYAYCNNNPIMYIDPTGKCKEAWRQGYYGPCPGQGKPGCMDNYPEVQKNAHIRDVTEEVNVALYAAAALCRVKRRFLGLLSYLDFYGMVNHGEEWDIKEEKPWEETIETPYPGEDTYIFYDGQKMKLEDLGNYTYGYLGYAYGFSLIELLAGSYGAAGFPKEGTDLIDEFQDWNYVISGYMKAKWDREN